MSSKKLKSQNITVIGAGLAGCAIALYCVRHGYEVEIFEKRADPRQLSTDFGRSINLALMHRGMYTLNELGLLDEVKKTAVPMRGRAIHSLDGRVNFQPFGRQTDEYICAISRANLNAILLNALTVEKKVTFHFEHTLTRVDFEKHELFFLNSEKKSIQHKINCVIGADGVASALRHEMMNAGISQFQTDWLSHGYKELMIPKEFGRLYEQETLLSWPRNSYMLLGNPNFDGSWTLTLFLALKGELGFDQLENADALKSFFQTNFPDVAQHMPTLTEDFFEHPIGKMATIHGSPWYYQDKYLLIGDAAHGIVPFFGQGMNSSFEDCHVLNDLIGKHKGEWATIFSEFYRMRQPNCDAVAKMSMENYLEIRDKVNDPKFLLHRQIELALMNHYGNDYLSRHVMVMFYRYPYAFIHACTQLQDQLLSELMKHIDKPDHINWAEVDSFIQPYFKEVKELKEKYQLLPDSYYRGVEKSPLPSLRDGRGRKT